MDQFPLTRHGKIDRGALPEPEQALRESRGRRASDIYQEMLTGIWEEVLGVENIGVEEDFFELGGHSLLATQLMSRVREAFGVELELRCLFEEPTIEGLGKRVEKALSAGDGSSEPPIERIAREGAISQLPLSYAQQRLWFLDQLRPADPSYNCPTAMRMEGLLNVPALVMTLTEIVRRHEILRTRFVSVAGEPAQAILLPETFNLPIIDLCELGVSERDLNARLLIDKESRRAFHLAEESLVRVQLLRLDVNDHIVIFNIHHIIGDAWSLGILTRETATLYEAFAKGEPSPLPELTIQYADYAVWQRKLLQGDILKKHLDYWVGQLSGVREPLHFRITKNASSGSSDRGARKSLMLSNDLSYGIRRFCRNEGVTLFMFLLAVLDVHLHYYTRRDDIVVGAAFANRNRLELEKLIGFFVNALVMRVDLGGNPSFQELLKQVRKVALDAHAHQDLPFELVVKHLNPERNPGSSPLFNVMFGLQNAPMSALKLPQMSLSSLGADNGAARFDLTVLAADTEMGIVISAEYKKDLFEVSMIDQMLRSFRNITQSVITKPDRRLSDISLSDSIGIAGYSPSDFQDSGISRMDYERLIIELGQVQTDGDNRR